MNHETHASTHTNDPPTEPPVGRASGLAVLSLLCSLLSLGVCCLAGFAAWAFNYRLAIVILPLPLLGILGVTLGWTAFLRAKRSSVPVMGRNAAIMGIFLGLVSVIMQGAAISGVMLAYSPLKQKLTPAMAEFAAAAGAGDRSALRAKLEPVSNTAIDDARLTTFLNTAGATTDRWTGASVDLTMIRANHALIRDAQQRNSITGDPPDAHPWPVWIDTAKGRRTTLVFLDDKSLGQGNVLIQDVLVLLDDWRAAPLLPDGPARQFATYLGMDDATE